MCFHPSLFQLPFRLSKCHFYMKSSVNSEYAYCGCPVGQMIRTVVVMLCEELFTDRSFCS